MTSSLTAVLQTWNQQLSGWAKENSISKASRAALAIGNEEPLIQQLEAEWAAGDFSGLPPIELLTAEAMPGAAAAYAVSTGTIYLNQDWLNTASEDQVQAVLTEELGHHLDAVLNRADTPGDEGELFAEQLLGQELSAEQRQAIQQQNDQLQILVDGQWITAEAAIDLTPVRPGGDDPEVLTGTPDDDLIDGFGGDDTITGLEGDDTLIGGDGNDAIDGGTGTNSIFGDNGDDTITSSGNDTVDAGGGNNSINITATAAGGTYTSGSGNDSYTVENGATGITINAGDGINTINAQGNITRFDSGSSDDVVNLNTASDFIITGDGDDTITATGFIGINGIAGGQSRYRGIRAGDGNDSISLTGGSGNYIPNLTFASRIDGDAGNDTITLGGNQNYGGVRGGLGNDLIDASEANFAQYLNGDDGDDTITGTASRDNINGGSGVDQINAGNGNNLVRGGDGDDIITSGDGIDTLFGDDGNDTINAGAGDDNIQAGSGNDTINAGAGDDNIQAGSGDDSIDAGAGDDLARGGSGNDTFIASAGNDVFYGNSSAAAKSDASEIDTVVLSGNAADYTISQAFDATFGSVYFIQDQRSGSPDGLNTLYDIDALQFNDGSSQSLVDYYNANAGAGAGNQVLTGTPDDDLIDGFGGDDTITGLEGDDTLIGGDGNDAIDGGTGTNSIFGDNGDDTITSSGNDTVDAGGGNNSINITATAAGGTYTSGSGNDSYTVENGATGITINAGDGINTINAQGNITRFDSGSSDDVVNLNTASDFIITGDGDDTITATGFIGINGIAGGQSRYRGIRAGDGNDSISLTGGSGNYIPNLTFASRIDGDAGNDTITLGGNQNYGGVRGGLGNDLIDASEANFAQYLNGDDGDDTITGTASRDNINGGSGVDQINAGNGNNLVRGGDGDDIITSGDGIDTLFGDDGNDTINAGAGDDNIQAGSGNDTINAGAGDDNIQAGSGDDSIDAGAGDDLARGGSGNDTFIASAGNDVFYGNSSAAAKSDASEIDTVVLSGNAADYTISQAFDATFGSVYFIQDQRSGSPDGLNTLYDIDALQFNDGSSQSLVDYYNANAGAGAGNQVLTGTPDDDLIDGFGGDDTITGLEGDDTLIGGDGNDAIDGGTGTNSIFGDNGDDTITSSGNDTVDAGGGNNSINITATAAGGTYTSGSGNDSYTVENGATGITINAGDGINTINAQGNITRFDSGSSDDVVNLNTASDFIITGDGDDTITATGFIGINGIAGGQSRYRGIRAGDGNDSISLTGGSGNYIPNLTFASRIDGDAGNDTITLGGNQNYGGVRGGLGNDLIDASEANFAQYLNGDDGDDTITGTASRDNINGGSGVDQINAGNGNNLVRGGDGDDIITSGDGIDTLFGDDGNDTINAGAGDDNIQAGSGNDTINAGAGDDNIQAGSGDDSIDAGAGDDLAQGGSGNDTFIASAGNDVFYGNSSAAAKSDASEIDTVVLSGNAADYTISQAFDATFGSVYFIQDQRSGSPDGLNTLYDIDALQFNDGSGDIPDEEPEFIDTSLSLEYIASSFSADLTGTSSGQLNALVLDDAAISYGPGSSTSTYGSLAVSSTGATTFSGNAAAITAQTTSTLADGFAVTAANGSATTTADYTITIANPSAENNLLIDASGSGSIDGIKFGSTATAGSYAGTLLNSINLGAASDTATLADVAGTTAVLALDGGDGFDRLNGNVFGNSLTLTGLDQGTLDQVSFTSIENIYLKGGNDTVTIEQGGRLSGLLDGGAGNNTLVINDGSSINVETDGSISIGGGSGGGGSSFSGFQTIQVGTGSGTPETNTITLNGNSNTALITGPNSGTVDGTGFTNISDINLADGNDNAVLAATGSLTGTLDGGDGSGDQLTLNDQSNTLNLDQSLSGSISTAGNTQSTAITGFETIRLDEGSDVVNLSFTATSEAANKQSLNLSGGSDNNSGTDLSSDTLNITLNQEELLHLEDTNQLTAFEAYLETPTDQTISVDFLESEMTFSGFESGSITKEDKDPLTGLNVADGESFQKEFFRADTKEDKFGFKGISENGDYIFRIADSNDNLAADALTGSNYAVALVNRGSTFEEALADGDYVISNAFDVEDGQRSFISMSGIDVNNFKDKTDSGKYTALLINLDTMEADKEKKVGTLSKETNESFDDRLDGWGSTLSSSSNDDWELGDPIVDALIPSVVPTI